MKIKSLAAEALIIRHAEKRYPKERAALHSHRTHDVRQEARSALLAYGFLRGRELERLERKGSRPIDEKRVAALVKKYGDDEGLGQWLSSAE